MSSAFVARLLLEALARGERCVKLQSMPLIERSLAMRSVLDGVVRDDDKICVEEPMRLALHALRMGVPEKTVAAALDWRMFEEYAAWALEEAGFHVWRGLRVHGPGGFQVDALGLDGYGRGVVVECKHWNPRVSSPSRLREAARRHLERVRRLARYWHRLDLPRRRYRLVPLLLVLRETGLPRIIERVPVVPVSKLRGLIEELDYVIDDPSVAVVETPGEG